MTVHELAQKAALRPLVMSDGERTADGVYCGDLLSWVMGRAQSGSVWITIMQNVNVAAVAALSDVCCVIFAEGVTPDADALKAAEERGLNFLSGEESTYEIAVRLSQLL